MKQMTNILSNVNLPKYKPVLVKCLGVHNEEGWVEANLRNNYDEYDIIRVVEGAVRGRPNSTEDGHSTDRTLEIIRSFPDPDNKIELYQSNRFFKSLEEQKQTFLDYAHEGEWLFIVDCDEFYHEGEVNRVRKAIEATPEALEIIPTFLHYYRDNKHIRATHPIWNTQHQRIIRYQNGLKYHTHPVATDKTGGCTYFHSEYQVKRFTMPNLYIHHYGHAKSVEFHKMKSAFYNSELVKFGGRGGDASIEFDEKLDEFVSYKEDLSEILHYDGSHPKALENHPIMSHLDKFYLGDNSKKIKHWKEDRVYSKNELPNIVVWMEDFWGPIKMQPIYNVIRNV